MRCQGDITVRQARPDDAQEVSEILTEAAQWLAAEGIPLWDVADLGPERILPEVADGLYFLAECDGHPVGTLRFQLEDALLWPDEPANESAFIHRLAVRRDYAGGAVANAMLDWAVNHTAQLGRRFLRLDCDAGRAKLRRVYERFGFRYHSSRQVGAFRVARYEHLVRGEET